MVVGFLRLIRDGMNQAGDLLLTLKALLEYVLRRTEVRGRLGGIAWRITRTPQSMRKSNIFCPCNCSSPACFAIPVPEPVEIVCLEVGSHGYVEVRCSFLIWSWRTCGGRLRLAKMQLHRSIGPQVTIPTR